MIEKFWEKVWKFLIKINCIFPYDSAVPLKDSDPKEMKMHIQKYLYKHGHNSFIHSGPKLEIRSPSKEERINKS